MWRFAMILAAGSIMMSPLAASATVYTFHDTESSALSPSPVTFTFSLDTATAQGSGNGTTFGNVTITENGTPVSGETVGATYGTSLGSALFYLIDTSPMPFYTGSGTGIAFNTDTFAIADGATDGEGTLTISEQTATPTPEPATWALLFTGCAMVGAARFGTRNTRLLGRDAA